MCASMIDLKKAVTRITELEEELKSTRDGYEEEMTILVEKMTTIPRTFVQRTTSSSTTPILILMIVMMTMLMKLEWISWSLPPIKTSGRPPYY